MNETLRQIIIGIAYLVVGASLIGIGWLMGIEHVLQRIHDYYAIYHDRRFEGGNLIDFLRK